ncbi:MAG: S8 family serine peptidase [Luteimonas sp.]
MNWTALAIASAIFVAPVAYSGGKASGVANKVPAVSQPAAAAAEYSRFIVTYRAGSSKRTAATQRLQFDKASKSMGFGIAQMRTLGTSGALIHTARKLDNAGSKRLINELMKDPSILAVEPDRKLQRAFVPNDPLYAQQWHYRNGPGGINAEPAWDLSSGEGVIVAVIDTGITPHSELNANIIAGYDFISEDQPGVFDTAVDGDGRDPDPNDPGDGHDGECDIFGIPEDSSWHGTHVSGTIAASTNNGVGVAGVAYNARVQPVRALGKCGGFISDIVDAVTWASGGTVPGVPANANPADVINLSLGGGGACGVAEQQAYTAAIARGSIVVAAAGNSSGDVAGFTPASCAGVIAVSAVGPTGVLASYSNYGSLVSVAAPGGSGAAPAEDNVLSTLNLGARTQGTEAYAWYTGTSMASPHVAGIVALMQSVAATPLTAAQTKQILENTAYAANGVTAGCDVDIPCGAGIVDARFAVAVASGAESLPPGPPPPPPPAPGIPLANGVTVTGIEIETGGNIVYQLEVPNASSHLLFSQFGGTGDSDMYVRYGARPTDSDFDCRPFAVNNDENCYFLAPQGGTWYVRLNGFEAAQGVSLYTSFVDSGYPSALTAEPVRSRMLISWKGGDPLVDIYKNSALWKTVNNTGSIKDSRFTGPTQAVYSICNAGTQECSNPAASLTR